MSSVSRSRRVAHLDMDAFFASVELLRRPELKGRPVVVGGRRAGGPPAGDGFARLRAYAGRGVVTTCTYEARAFGVRSGMGLMRAAALAPDAILLPADFEAYAEHSRRFKMAVSELVPVIEDRGIDEIFLDLTEVEGGSEELGLRLKGAVRGATGLACSIGIAPNKLIAKLASELAKPDGLVVLGHEDVPARVWPLPVGALNGIGPKSGARLESWGIRTLGELAAADPAFLVRNFGRSYGTWLAEAARGRDDRPVVTHREPKSVSGERTFDRDLHPREDREALSRVLLELCERLGRELARGARRGRTVGVKLRYDDFRTLTRDVTLASATADPLIIREAARACLRRVPLDRRLRLLGVRVGSLVRDAEGGTRSARLAGNAVPLFDDPEG